MPQTMSSTTNTTSAGPSSSLLPQWMRQSLEHLSMKTNMEDYGTSPPESESLFLHEGKLPNYSMATYGNNKKSVDVSSGMVFRAKDLIVPRAPRSLSVAPAGSSSASSGSGLNGTVCVTDGDQVCPSVSAPQSAATTPTVTPQQSPTFFRKILANIDLDHSHCKGASGLSEVGTSRLSRLVPVTRVTNFDLNAVSPTSW